jgi:uncharacterized protein YoxC
MPLLLEICFVIVTIAVVAIAIAIIRALSRLGKITEQIDGLALEVREWVGQLKHVTSGAEDLVTSVREIVPPIRRVVGRFEAIGDRTAQLSGALLEEVERPLRTAVAVARGVRTGTAHFLERITNRFHRGRAATNGGYGNE